MTLVPHSSRESKVVEQFPAFDHNPLPCSGQLEVAFLVSSALLGLSALLA